MARRILLLVNPGSRSGHAQADEAARRLEGKGLVIIRPNDQPCELYADIVRKHRDAVDVVVVGGGDGSLKLALPGVLAAGLPLGVLPLGTANNFARNTGIPLDLAAACEVIASGSTRRVDVASANGMPFLNVAGLGLSSEINHKIPRDLKRRWGMLGYALYALKIAKRMRPIRAEITCDGETVHVRSLQITVCNGRHYGTALVITPAASIDDGKLDLSSAEVETWWQGLHLLPTLVRGNTGEYEALRWLHGRRIELRTRRPMWVDVDGDPALKTPVIFEIMTTKLTVLAPPKEHDEENKKSDQC